MGFNSRDKEMIARGRNQNNLLGGVTCARCGRSFPMDIMEVDHIHPESKGGSNRPSNLRLLCPACNRKKGAKIEREKQGNGLSWDIPSW
jgi:5-methylcytosine-specific restriction endonuclease McrA